MCHSRKSHSFSLSQRFARAENDGLGCRRRDKGNLYFSVSNLGGQDFLVTLSQMGAKVTMLIVHKLEISWKTCSRRWPDYPDQYTSTLWFVNNIPTSSTPPRSYF